jgi:hypothetical protein
LPSLLEPLFDSYLLHEDEINVLFWYSFHSDNRVMVLCDSPGIPTCDVEVGASRCLLLRKVFRVGCAIFSQLESSKDIYMV